MNDARHHKLLQYSPRNLKACAAVDRELWSRIEFTAGQSNHQTLNYVKFSLYKYFNPRNQRDFLLGVSSSFLNYKETKERN